MKSILSLSDAKSKSSKDPLSQSVLPLVLVVPSMSKPCWQNEYIFYKYKEQKLSLNVNMAQTESDNGLDRF